LLERGIALISYASANLHFSDKKKILKNRRKAVSLFIGILPPNASRTGTEGARPMDIQDIAKEVLPVIGTGRQITPFSKADPDFSLNEAYRVSAPYARREKRAEAPDWPQDRVHQPDHLGGIWRLCADLGYVYDRTVRDLTSEPLEVPCSAWPTPGSSQRSCLALRAAGPWDPDWSFHADTAA
jgi:hypothetical protein